GRSRRPRRRFRPAAGRPGARPHRGTHQSGLKSPRTRLGRRVSGMIEGRRALSITTVKQGISMAKILIVDDSETHLYSLQKIVEGGGHEVITASSGEEGVEQAKAHVPDVILMDIVMPGLNGF